jgi:hypothetical protein
VDRVPGMTRVTGHTKLVERKRGSVWYVKYRGADGRQVQKMLGPAHTGPGRPPAGYFTKKLAQEKLQEILTDARRGTLEGATVRTGRTFEDACAEWLRYVTDDRQRAKSTVRDYSNVVSHYLLPAFGKTTPIEKITTDAIDAFRDELLASDISRRTGQKVLVLLHGVMSRAKRKRWTEASRSPTRRSSRSTGSAAASTTPALRISCSAPTRATGSLGP